MFIFHTNLLPRVRSQRGFTMIEVMIAAAIVTTLAVAFVPTLLSKRGVANDARVKTNLSQALAGAQNYYGQGGSYDAQGSNTTCKFMEANNPRMTWHGVGCTAPNNVTDPNTTYSTPSDINVVAATEQQLELCAKSDSGGRYFCLQDNNDALVTVP